MATLFLYGEAGGRVNEKTCTGIQNDILDGKPVLLRKLEPMERHYYNFNEYLYDGVDSFWLILKSSHDDVPKT